MGDIMDKILVVDRNNKAIVNILKEEYEVIEKFRTNISEDILC